MQLRDGLRWLLRARLSFGSTAEGTQCSHPLACSCSMGSSLLSCSQPFTCFMAAAPSRSRATRPPQSHGQQQQRAGRSAAAATSSLHHQAGVSVSATPAARGAAQAAFLQLTCSVRDEVEQQRRMVHDVFADLCLRCDELIGSGAERPPAVEDELHGTIKSDRPAHSADRAFSVPAQPFRFDTAAPPRAALSNSLSQLYSDVQRLEQPDTARDSKQCNLIAEVTLTVDERSPSASPLDDELQHPQPPPPQRPSSPLRSSSPPLKQQQSQAAADVLPSTGQPTDQPSVSFMADIVAVEPDQPTNGSHSIATSAAHSPAPISKAGAAINPMLDSRSSISSSLADFPALQRVAAQRAASLQMAAAPALVGDPFPSLSRALLLRQQRLQACSDSALPSHAPPSASAAVPSAMAPGARPRPLARSFATSSTDFAPTPAAASTPIHRAPAAPFGINPDASAPIHARSALDASEQHDDASPSHPVLSAEEEERRSVQSLLKQQALNLICNQVQMRVKQLTVSLTANDMRLMAVRPHATPKDRFCASHPLSRCCVCSLNCVGCDVLLQRQRFFLSWQWRWKLSHLAATLARRKVRSGNSRLAANASAPA